MDQTIRRFWPIKRKSLKNPTKPETTEVPTLPALPVLSHFEYNISYEATVSGPPPEVGSLPMKPSSDAKPRKSFGHYRARSTGLQEFRTVAEKDTQSRATSSGEIKPILVAISRPATAIGKQLHHTESGNNGASLPPVPVAPPLDMTAALAVPNKAHDFQLAPKRHVDIMSFAAATGKHIEAYNEEIAERNLDLVAVAKKSTTTTYTPKKRYQEDVASRRAASMGYSYKKEAPLLKLPADRLSKPLNSSVVKRRPVNAAQQPYKHEGEVLPSAQKMVSTPGSAAHHSRNASANFKKLTPLPPISQEQSVEEGERVDPILENDSRPTTEQKSQEEGKSQRTTRYPSLHGKKLLAEAGQPTSYPPLTKLSTRANEGPSVASGSTRDHRQPLNSNAYEAPIVEYAELAAPTNYPIAHGLDSKQPASSSSQQTADNSPLRPHPLSSRTSSADQARSLSSFGYSRDTLHRTYMDLTGDEPEPLSKVSTTSQNLDYLETPVVAQAQTNTLQLQRAQLPGSDSYHNPGFIASLDPADGSTSSRRKYWTENRQSMRWSGAFSDNGIFDNTQPLAFSGITTMSSMSPTSRPIHKRSRATESSRTARSGDSILHSPTLQRAPFSDIEKSSYAGAKSHHVAVRSLDSRTKAPIIVTPPGAPTRPDSSQGPAASQTPHPVYTSPESLDSGDFIDPSRSFGVTARDFASTPSRQSTARPQAPRQRSQPLTAVATRPRAPRQKSEGGLLQDKQSTPRPHVRGEYMSNSTANGIHELPVSQSPQNTPQVNHIDNHQDELIIPPFDEGEFARKQAQARAALLRLQMSLEEIWDMSPGRPDSSTQRHVAKQILDQTHMVQPEDLGSADAPTSIYHEQMDYQSKKKVNRPTQLRVQSENVVTHRHALLRAQSENIFTMHHGYTKHGPRAFPSVHSFVTVAPTATAAKPLTLAAGHTKTSSAGSASHSYNYANSNATNSSSNRTPTLPNPPLTPVLPSPSGTEVSETEVSLSNFPVPQSPEERGRASDAELERPKTARMHSQKSSASTQASAYSIPHHMVPRRDSSRRDQLDEAADTWS